MLYGKYCTGKCCAGPCCTEQVVQDKLYKRCCTEHIVPEDDVQTLLYMKDYTVTHYTNRSCTENIVQANIVQENVALIN